MAEENIEKVELTPIEKKQLNEEMGGNFFYAIFLTTAFYCFVEGSAIILDYYWDAARIWFNGYINFVLSFAFFCWILNGAVKEDKKKILAKRKKLEEKPVENV